MSIESSGGDPDDAAADGSPRRFLRRRRRARVAVGAGAVAVIAVAGLAAYGIDVGVSEPSVTVGLTPATDTVTRMTLTDTEKVTGSLGYGAAKTVTARGGAGASTGAGSTAGTVTWLPGPGSIVRRGRAVYRVDDEPVPLLYGALPLYRVLRDGVEGADVKQFERNLSALGYTGFTVDDRYTSATAEVARQWQEDLGLDETGTIDVHQVVVASGAIRVAELVAAVGDPASGPVLTFTGNTRVVEIDLDVSMQHLVRKGIAATVSLPDGSTVEGEVSSVGTVATGGEAAGGGGQDATTIDVVVTVSDQKALGSLDAAPVSVTLVSDTRDDVLTVPVAALVALAEGGYGVQVIDGASMSYVAVTTGLFANGRVEITGEGIVAGVVVGMPA